MRAERWRRVLVCALAAVTLLAGCGEDEESSTPDVPAATGTTISQVEVDRARSQRIVLTAGDLPGFTADPSDSGDDEETDFDRALAACLHGNALLLGLDEPDDPRGAASPDFEREQLTVASAATFGESEEEARAAMTELGAASFPGCYAKAANDAARGDPDFANSTVSTNRLATASAGEETIAFRNLITNLGGTRLTFYLDYVFVRSGRAVAYVIVGNVGAPFPDDERERLVAAVAGRM